MTRQKNRNLNGYRLLVRYLEEIDVEQSLLYGVKLELFYYSHTLRAVDVQSYNLSVRSVDQFANVSYVNCECLVAVGTIDVAGNEFLLAQALSGFLAELRTECTG